MMHKMQSNPTNLTDLPTESILLIADYLPYRLGLPIGALNKALVGIFRNPDSIAVRAISHYATPTSTLVWESMRSEPGQHLVIRAIHERLLHCHPGLIVDDCELFLSKYHINMTPLQAAAFVGNTESVHALLELGAKADGTDWRDQGHPLLRACTGGHIEVVRLLLENGAASNEPRGWSLAKCVEKGNIDLVRLLLNGGAEVNYGDGRALTLAAGYGYFDIAKLLVDQGAHVDLNDNSALWAAVRTGGIRMVKFLLESGADPKADSPHKRGAIKEAGLNGHGDTIKFLRAHNRRTTGNAGK
ncbi:hypothetical protein HDU93_001155 [Gonapodya sp. JEL0774]|nr:hypothetical protein HDU93_001155 [Gonapodya sp. JEL0774]